MLVVTQEYSKVVSLVAGQVHLGPADRGGEFVLGASPERPVRLHPRRQQVHQAENDIATAVEQAISTYELTFVESLQILGAIQSEHLKWMLRAERHPDDPSKKGDEA